MGKKNWVFVKRGLITDPKHRQVMGETIWLFEYMLDLADFETGCVYDWRDGDIAEDMSMSKNTVRDWRQALARNGYILCTQSLHKLTITIYNWTNPRDYAGKIINLAPGKADPGDNANGDIKDSPSADVLTSPYRSVHGKAESSTLGAESESKTPDLHIIKSLIIKRRRRRLNTTEITLSPELRQALQEAGIYTGTWEDIRTRLAEGWTETDIFAVLRWMISRNPGKPDQAAGRFVGRIREKTKAPSSYYPLPDREPEPEGGPEPAGDPAWEPSPAVTRPIQPGRSMTPEMAWTSALGQLKMEMSQNAFATWLQDTYVLDFDGKQFFIFTRSRAIQEWLESRMTSTAERLLLGICNQPVRVTFQTPPGP